MNNNYCSVAEFANSNDSFSPLVSERSHHQFLRLPLSERYYSLRSFSISVMQLIDHEEILETMGIKLIDA